jgi:hypothetical protein
LEGYFSMHNVDYLEGSIESLVVLSFSRLNLSLYFLDHCVSLHLAASIFHFFFSRSYIPVVLCMHSVGKPFICILCTCLSFDKS